MDRYSLNAPTVIRLRSGKSSAKYTIWRCAGLRPAIIVILLITILISSAAESSAGDTDPVVMARATWDTGWFQAEIYRLLLEEMGYQVEGPSTMENEVFYDAVAEGTVDFWVNGWFPLHRRYIENLRGNRNQVVPLGQQVPEGALQGYLIDRRTAEKYNIKSIDDLKDPEIAAIFDRDGNGKADLIGCNEGWACSEGIEYQLDAYGLRKTVEHIQGDYSPLMGNIVDQYKAGEPVFFYTWTPNWTVGILRPGIEVVWLQVPFPALPSQNPEQEARICVDEIQGCPDDPCCLGWPPNDIRVVANRSFLENHPAIRSLLADVQISVDDIHEQNSMMIAGEDTPADIRTHAVNWIMQNRSRVRQWLENARKIGIPGPAAGGKIIDGSKQEDDRQVLRIATKVLPPFVLYEDLQYKGFSIDLFKAISRELGMEYELYGVNSLAKLLDESVRGVADASIAAIALTAEREHSVDFSHPYFESGLQILVPLREEGFISGFLSRIYSLLKVPQLLDVVLLFFLVIFIVAHIIWIIERKRNPEFPHGYLPGVFAGLWWGIVTVTTVGYGDKTPRRNTGKLFALLWLLAGYFVFAYFTASVTTTFTLSGIKSTLDSPDDLFDRRIGTVEDSTPQAFLRDLGIRTIEGPTIEEVIADLEAGKLDAVVYHAPFLQYYAAHSGKGKVRVSGLVFSKMEYSIALPQKSQLREPLNRALLTLIENGTYREIYDRWFD